MARVEKSLKNINTAAIGYIFKMLVQFFARRIFIVILGEVYLGLSGLFSNILTLLSLAELGIGNAITFALYEPLAKDRREDVKSLMALFRKAYIAIGFFVLAVGVALTPFLQYLVKDMPDIRGIRLIYVIYVLNAAVSYFYSYKRTLIIADQREFIVSRYSYGCAVAMNILQVVILLLTRNFFAYLAVMFASTVAENVLVFRSADRHYPYLKDRDVQPLPERLKKPLVKNIQALVYHQVGRVVVNGTDSILIAKMVDLVSVGLYSNYLMIKSALQSALGIVFSALYASIGDVNATETDEVKLSVFERLLFFSQWLYGFCTICLICLFNPFIGSVWLGERYLFAFPTVLVICLHFYVEGMRQPVLITKNAMGLYWYDRYKPIAESVINLGTSILLALRFGVTGVILGTIISSLTTNFWVEPLVLYKQGFHAPVKSFFARVCAYTAVSALIALVTLWICSLLPASGLWPFLVKCAVCAVVPNALYLLVYRKNEHFRYFWDLALSLLRARRGGEDA